MSYHTKCLEILQTDGPMSLRELSAKVSIATGKECRYQDLAAALDVYRKLGDVEVNDTGRDYRDHEWKAVV